MLRDFMDLGEGLGAIECDPKRVSVEWSGTRETYQTPLRLIAPTLMTTRSFSFLRIPSRLPRESPTTLSNFVPLIMLLSSRRDTVVNVPVGCSTST